jgi:hypothetical protein
LAPIKNNYDKLIKELALNNSIDVRICKAIIDAPFAYLKYLVTDPSIEEGVRFPYIGAFTQKGNYKNKAMRVETRKNILLENIVDVTIMMVTTLGFQVPTVESAKHVIDEAYEIGDYEKINMIWDGWVAYNN